MSQIDIINYLIKHNGWHKTSELSEVLKINKNHVSGNLTKACKRQDRLKRRKGSELREVKDLFGKTKKMLIHFVEWRYE